MNQKGYIRPLKKCLDCEKIKPHMAKGRCKSCYRYHQISLNPEKFKNKAKEQRQKNKQKRNQRNCQICFKSFLGNANKCSSCKTKSWRERNPNHEKEYRENNKELIYQRTIQNSSYRWKIDISHCEMCFKPELREASGTIVVHHKDENHHNNDIENLQALCRSCHGKVHNIMNKMKAKLGIKKNVKQRTIQQYKIE